MYEPSQIPNYGLEISGESTTNGNRQFESVEGKHPPELVVDFTPPPATVTVPTGARGVKVDGACTASEYAAASRYEYVDFGGFTGIIYLVQDNTNLYVCIQGAPGRFQGRFFGVYLDRDLSNNPRSKYTTSDDYSLRVNVMGNQQTTWQGTGTPTAVYTEIQTSPYNWTAQAVAGRSDDTAEYQIPISALAQTCGTSFGLAIYHQAVTDSGVDYGWPTRVDPNFPSTWITATLKNPNCPIRVCLEQASPCSPALGATVRRTADGAEFATDKNGEVINRAGITEGNQIWATVPVTITSHYTVFYTSGAPQTVNPAAFSLNPPGVMTLVISRAHPLMLHDLSVSAQWYVEGDPAYRTKLAQDILAGSAHLYDFTNGQVGLGQVTVYQDFAAWDSVDVHLFASNDARPEADMGGIVKAPTPDPQNPAIIYRPGRARMGATWNRFNLPGTASVPHVDTSDDWALVLAHEMGHYLLYLNDTYYRIGPKNTIVNVYSCKGSAMGWVYEPENSEFVFDQKFWDANCRNTFGNNLLDRTEWNTIRTWYPWAVPPNTVDPGPVSMPAGLTKITFVSPLSPTLPLTNQVFALDYRDGETASSAARAVIYRHDRVIDEGRPPQGTTQIELHGAQPGDRFCVTDINIKPKAPDTPRHQFGCEHLTAGDNQLFMAKNTAWAPLVLLTPVTSHTFGISVTQVVTDTTLSARLYPKISPALRQSR